MLIHRVSAGETIYSIAEYYGVSPESITANNQLQNPDSLVVGQTLVILYPKSVYTVQAGDTLESISRKTGVPVITLRRNNPIVNSGLYIYEGQTIVLDYQQEKIGNLNVNGYAYTYISDSLLAQCLPYLTFLSIFSYGITSDGNLVYSNDEHLLKYAKEYNVKPILVITSLTEDGKFSSERVSDLLSNYDAQQNLINNLVNLLKEKGYYGADIDFEFIPSEYAQTYAAFIGRLAAALNAEGMVLFTALAPKISSDQKGLLYEGHNYELIGAASNYVLVMTYEWGYTYGPPMAVAPINNVKQVLDYAVSVIPPEKIFMGIPNYGYDWPLPFVAGETMATSISNVDAVEIANTFKAVIEYDYTAAAPHFNYYNGYNHEVWFEDAKSIETKLLTAKSYNLAGVGYWNLMRYFPQNWLVLNALFNINSIN
ncbi:Spore germination protein YaaH [bioreactor metagenome]|uniref:Spore germination protein YaaH n=1 Tax=bioreactor metagenome TaxID=1076179 RepID=A0A645BFP7_9ZZZZ|nr:glycosyl hydrolase family 18 protein [Candidatus Metalachnospira sp.]